MEITIVYFLRSISKHVTDKEPEDIRGMIKKYQDLYYTKKITTRNNLELISIETVAFWRETLYSALFPLMENSWIIFFFLR